MPIFHYDHIVEYADAQQHTVENLALLCPNHHQDKTSGRLDGETVAAWRKQPFNSNRGVTSGHQLSPSRRFNAVLGANSGWKDFGPGGGDYAVLWANGVGLVVIHAEEGWLSLSMRLTDSNGTQLLVVDRGELSVSTAAWDYEFVGCSLQIRRALGEILVDLELMSSRVRVKKGTFMHEGAGFSVDGEKLMTMVDGRLCTSSLGCYSYNNEFGAWGISTTGTPPPGGFGNFVG